MESIVASSPLYHDEENCMSHAVVFSPTGLLEQRENDGSIGEQQQQQQQQKGGAASVSSLGEASFQPGSETLQKDDDDEQMLETGGATGARKRLLRLAILTNILFVLASILYIGKSHGHLQWTRKYKDVPVTVLMADDDLTWQNYYQAQQQSQGRHSKQKRRVRSLKKKGAKKGDYDKYRWEELPKDIKLSLEVLGHHKISWEKKENVPADKLSWWQLSDIQRTAAKTLGYTEETWNATEEGASVGFMYIGEPSFSSKDEDEKEKDADLLETVLEQSSSTTSTGPKGPVQPPTIQPQPTSQPTRSPTRRPTSQPTNRPTSQPTNRPTKAPKQSKFKTEPPSPTPTPTVVVKQDDSTPSPASSNSDNNEFDERKFNFDDDTIASTGSVDVGTDQVLYLLASLCMLAVGILSWFREGQIFHIWMVQGGLFGALSALAMSISDFGALMLQTVSVHCFLVEAYFLIQLRATGIRPLTGLRRLSYALWTADLFFAVGTIMQIALVYWLHSSNSEAMYNLNYGDGDVFSAWCWGISSVVYLTVTVILSTPKMQQRLAEEESEKKDAAEVLGENPTEERHEATPVMVLH